MITILSNFAQPPLTKIVEFSVAGSCNFTKKHYLGRENAVRWYGEFAYWPNVRAKCHQPFALTSICPKKIAEKQITLQEINKNKTK